MSETTIVQSGDDDNSNNAEFAAEQAREESHDSENAADEAEEAAEQSEESAEQSEEFAENASEAQAYVAESRNSVEEMYRDLVGKLDALPEAIERAVVRANAVNVAAPMEPEPEPEPEPEEPDTVPANSHAWYKPLWGGNY